MRNNQKKNNWKRTFKNNGYMLALIIKACPGVPILALISTVLGSVHSFLLNTYLYQYALNALQEGKELKIILITLGCMFGYSILYMLFQNISNCYFELKYPKVEAYIQNLLQKKAVEVDLSCFESSTFYDTYVKATGEALIRAYTVMNNILDVIGITINVVAVGTLIITIDPIFLLIAFLPFLCTLLIGKKRNRLKYNYNMRNKEVARQRDYVRRTFYLNDFSKEMRLTEMWKVMYKRMHSSISEMKELVNKYGYKMMFFRYLFDFVFDIVVDLGSIIIAAYKTLVAKSMLLGDCFVVINSISNIAGSVNYIGDIFFKIDENSLYVDNLRDFLEYEVHITEDENAPAVSSFEKLELKNITFGYEGQETPALSNVNMTVNVGEKIAIVGYNGAGKTTLIKLLQRLYDPSEGEVLLNGENIKNYRLSSYRNLFGTVFQDYRLFATTVAENVMLRGNITDEDRVVVKNALKKSGIWHIIGVLFTKYLFDSILKNISKILYKYSKFFNDVIPLHGAGIEYLGKAHIFLAPTTGGKTTLTSYLINKGLGYISDDCILLNKEDGYIVPYTTPIHLRIGGFEALKKIGEQPKEYTHVDDGYVSRLVYTPNNLVVNPLPIKRIYYLDRTSNMNKINKRSFYQNFNTALISQMVLTDINSSNTQCFAHFAQNEFIHICYNDFEYVYDYIINNQED